MTKTKIIRGDRVRYQGHPYVVTNTNRQGLLRLLASEEGAPHVPRLVAPTKVTLEGKATRRASKPPAEPARLHAVGQLLREARLACGFTTRTLADAIGVAQPVLMRWELGRAASPPSAMYLKRFAEATGADEDLLCATAGVVPVDLADALTDVETLRFVRTLVKKVSRYESEAAS